MRNESKVKLILKNKQTKKNKLFNQNSQMLVDILVMTILNSVKKRSVP